MSNKELQKLYEELFCRKMVAIVNVNEKDIDKISKQEYTEKVSDAIQQLLSHVKSVGDCPVYYHDYKIQFLDAPLIPSPLLKPGSVFIIPVSNSKPVKIYFEDENN